MDLITGGLYQGQEEYIKENYSSCFELFPFVKEKLKTGLSEDEILSMAIEMAEKYQAVDVLEVGAGMIPVDDFERELREVYGRIVCALAKKANSVIRIVCAIPTVIK